MTGDGKADAIAVNDETIPFGRVVVRRSNGSSFGPNEEWTQEPYYGDLGTYFADVTGDGRADAIVVNYTDVVVRRSNGSGFLPNEPWTQGSYYGNRGTYFADVTGDGKADAIAVNDANIPFGRVVVRRSNGSSFASNEEWTQGPYYGDLGTFFADVSGDGKADAIAVGSSNIEIACSTGSAFLPGLSGTQRPYYGSLGTFFADVTGDGKADAIVVNTGNITVRRSC